jgi:hypothetical protein
MTTGGIRSEQVRDGTLQMVDFQPVIRRKIADGWRDLTFPVTVRTTGPTAPTWAQIGGSIFEGWRFDIGNQFFTDFHINHDYKPDGDVLMHVHWLCDGTSTQPVRWQLDYVIAKGHAQGADSVFDFANPTTVLLTQAPTGTAHEHMVTEMLESIPKARLEPDTLISCRFRRVTNGGTDNPNPIFARMSDCHYQADRHATPQRAPNFYAEA